MKQKCYLFLLKQKLEKFKDQSKPREISFYYPNYRSSFDETFDSIFEDEFSKERTKKK